MPNPNNSPYTPLDEQGIEYWQDVRERAQHKLDTMTETHMSELDIRTNKSLVDAANRYLPPECVEQPQENK